jgi:hypothetical protein
MIHTLGQPALSAQLPPGLLHDRLVEVEIVGALGRRAHERVDALGVVAHEDAPFAGLDAPKDGGRGCGRRRRRARLELTVALGDRLLDLLV